MIKYKSHLYDDEALGRLCGKILTLAYLEALLGRAKLILIIYKNEAGQPRVWLWSN